jgi:hypothetical protein
MEVLREEEPLSRRSLHDREIVQALWEAAENHSQTGAASPRECAIVLRGFQHTNVQQYEIRTALDYFDISSYETERISDAFEHRILRSNSEPQSVQ